MRRYWAWVSPIYYVTVLKILWTMCPIFEDGGGPTATFFCPNCPAPTAGEFQARYWELIWIFATPYLIAAFLLTLLGCGVAPRLAKGAWLTGWTSWWLILLLGVVVDVGTRTGVWNAASRIFIWDDWIIYMQLKTTSLVAAVTTLFAWLQGPFANWNRRTASRSGL